MSKQRHDQDEHQTPSRQEQADEDQQDRDSASTSPDSTHESSPSATESNETATPSSSRQTVSNAQRHESDEPSSATEATPGKDKETSRTAGTSAPGKRSDANVAKTAKKRSQRGKSSQPDTSSSGTGKSTSQSSSTSNGPTPRTSSSGGGRSKAGGTAATGGTSGGGAGKAGIVALVLVVVLAVAVILAGWWGWQRLDQQQQRLTQVDTNAEAISELESRLEESASERQSALDDALQSLRSEFEDYRGEVNGTLDDVLAELSREQDTDEREWLHAEAAYLLRLANQRLQLERDAEGAAALLRTADERLREADNPALTPVRREIASELAALDSVAKVDRTGLYLALNAQQEQLADLPLKQDIEAQAVEGEDAQAPEGGWRQQLSHFGAELKDLVTVRRHDQALEALISPEQESYLRQNVRLLIEQAQLALLKEEGALYEESLDEAMTLVETYYDSDRDSVQSVLDRLEALRGEVIRPELPDISGSQQALATFIERRFEDGGDRATDDQEDDA
ncbi:uroporphyrinogen-III C-methyltransferase [Aidingimonas lacisalsi]|uniref:uroporphyrinogen-III C-methyltransferase n=1 Tax=Aidingimonas lacisalsi TaxID=2604086 RepID=UPI0011D2BA01|nr:uroporphyrinogen-III C-methyltransferase [Aidingimonas lacisalsi]